MTTELQSEGLRTFVNAQHEARGAIAAIDQYVPGGLRMYWDKFEMDETDFIELQKILKVRRRQLFKLKLHRKPIDTNLHD